MYTEAKRSSDMLLSCNENPRSTSENSKKQFDLQYSLGSSSTSTTTSTEQYVKSQTFCFVLSPIDYCENKRIGISVSQRMTQTSRTSMVVGPTSNRQTTTNAIEFYPYSYCTNLYRIPYHWEGDRWASHFSFQSKTPLPFVLGNRIRTYNPFRARFSRRVIQRNFTRLV